MEDKIEELFYRNIYTYVADNFGENEAEDPSWDIHELAKALAHSTLVYDIQEAVERDYRKQDMRYIANEMGVELTEQEQGTCLEEFMDSEEYCDIKRDLWKDIIRHEIEHRKENK